MEQIFAASAVPTGDTTSEDYRIAPLDVLEISVFGVPELTRTAQVSSSGTITMPLIKTIKAGGRTASELEREIAKKLQASYLQEPQVSVFIKEYNSQRITVDGAVKKPGIYPITGKVSLLQAIALGRRAWRLLPIRAASWCFAPPATSAWVRKFDITQDPERQAERPDAEGGRYRHGRRIERAHHIARHKRGPARSPVCSPCSCCKYRAGMNHISNIPNANDRGGNQRAIVPGDPANVPDPYRRDSHLYPYYPVDLEVERAPRFDFFKYVRIAIKYRWLILGTTVAALVLAAIITFLKTPIYQTTASIQIEREAMNVVEVGDLQPNEMRTGQDFYQTQYELLGSMSLASRVVSTLGLMDDPAFNQPVAPSLLGMVRQGIGSIISGPASGDDGKENNESADALDARAQGSAGKLRSMLGISPVRGSRIVNITISHPNPALAQRLANGYAEVYIADNLDRRYEASSYARKFLEDRLQQLRVRLEESERQLVRYAEQKGIINLDDRKSLAGTDLEAINTRLREARNDRIRQELLWKQAQTTDGLWPPTNPRKLGNPREPEASFRIGGRVSTEACALQARLSYHGAVTRPDTRAGQASAA